MNKRSMTLIGLMVLGMLILQGCQTSKIFHYVHEPSQSFYENMDFQSEKIKDFKSNGILFVIDVKEVQKNKYFVWLGLYAEKEITLVINGAHISGDNWSMESRFNKKLIIDYKIKKMGLVKDSIRLFKVEGDVLNQVAGDGSNITIEVGYSINGKKKIMTFSLHQKIEKQTVFPT